MKVNGNWTGHRHLPSLVPSLFHQYNAVNIGIVPFHQLEANWWKTQESTRNYQRGLNSIAQKQVQVVKDISISQLKLLCSHYSNFESKQTVNGCCACQHTLGGLRVTQMGVQLEFFSIN